MDPLAGVASKVVHSDRKYYLSLRIHLPGLAGEMRIGERGEAAT